MVVILIEHDGAHGNNSSEGVLVRPCLRPVQTVPHAPHRDTSTFCYCCCCCCPRSAAVALPLVSLPARGCYKNERSLQNFDLQTPNSTAHVHTSSVMIAFSLQPHNSKRLLRHQNCAMYHGFALACMITGHFPWHRSSYIHTYALGDKTNTPARKSYGIPFFTKLYPIPSNDVSPIHIQFPRPTFHPFPPCHKIAPDFLTCEEVDFCTYIHPPQNT